VDKIGLGRLTRQEKCPLAKFSGSRTSRTAAFDGRPRIIQGHFAHLGELSASPRTDRSAAIGRFNSEFTAERGARPGRVGDKIWSIEPCHWISKRSKPLVVLGGQTHAARSFEVARKTATIAVAEEVVRLLY